MVSRTDLYAKERSVARREIVDLLCCKIQTETYAASAAAYLDSNHKPPYFTALYFRPDLDTYAGGGFFIDDNTVLFNNTGRHEGVFAKPHEHFSILSEAKIYSPTALFYKQLENYGWVLAEQLSDSPQKMRSVWHKHVEKLTLSLIYTPKKCSYRLTIDQLPTDHLNAAAWADFDQQNRLVFARAGKLFTAGYQQGNYSEHELADFNGNQFESVDAPDWAKRW